MKSWSILRAVAAAAVLAASGAHADEPVSFGGEDYAVAHRDVREVGNSLVELVRDGDAIESWQKLVAFHRFPDLKGTPKEAAHGLAAMLRQRDPSARFAMIENPTTGEVIIDFMTGEESSDVVEFNVFKYARHPSGNGIVAFQFAERFKLGEADRDEVKKVREAAVDEAAGFDISLANGYLRRGGTDGPGDEDEASE
jgi:hypothetical protein